MDFHCPIKLTLDSGAFGVWARNLPPLDLREYMRYLERNHDLLEAYACMDMLPGTRNLVPTRSQCKESAETSLKNLRIMLKAGLSPIGVFHQGESIDYLGRMIDAGCKYIGLSLIGSRGFKYRDALRSRRDFLDSAFAYLCSGGYFPGVKVHGFAMTAISLMTGYPWYSVDSAAWVRVGAYGSVFVPSVKTKDGYDFRSPPHVFHVSLRGVNKRTKTPGIWADGKNYHKLPDHMRDYVDEYVRYMGFNPEEIYDYHAGLKCLSARYYLRVGEACDPRPFSRGPRLFAESSTAKIGRATPDWDHLRVLMVTAPSANIHLQIEGARTRMISYLDIAEGRMSPDISEFVRTGLTDADIRILTRIGLLDSDRPRVTVRPTRNRKQR